jgi:hypothetical protein
MSSAKPEEPLSPCHAQAAKKNDDDVMIADQIKTPIHFGQDLVTFKDGSWIYCCRRPAWLQCGLLGVLGACGFAEGVAFQRSGILDPNAIVGQMTFKSWVVMRMFLSAVGASMVLQGAMDVVVPSFFVETRGARYNRQGYARNAIGGALLGAGMAIAGTGPTILPAMIGAGTGNAWVAALGFLAGGLAFYALDRVWLHKYHIEVDEKKDKLVVDEIVGTRYYKLALPLGALFFGAASALEFALAPRANDEPKLQVGKLLLPTVAVGAVIGLNQIAYRFIAHHGQGGSSAVMVMLSALTWGKIAPGSFPNAWPRVWQLAFVWGGTLLGAAWSARATAGETRAAPGLSPLRAALGGFLAVFGSRIAGGCTCGQGITAVSELSLEGFVTAAAIFGGGIATAVIAEALRIF